MKKRFFLSILLSALAYSVTFGHIPNVLRPNYEYITNPEYSSYHARPLIQSERRALQKRPYNVLQYNLFMDWRNPLESVINGGLDHKFSGINKITVQSDSSNLQIISLDAAAIKIDSAILMTDNSALNISQLDASSGFNIALNKPISKGDTLTIAVYYTRVGQENRGFFMYPKGLFVGFNKNNDSVKTLAPIAYTMSEPQDARYWMPCNDNPYDKARYSLTLLMPFNAASQQNFAPSTSIQGKPQIEEFADSRAYHWSDTTHVSTYLVCVNASYFGMYRQWYKRASNPSDSIPVENYAWEDDIAETSTDPIKYNLKNSVERVPEMIKLFSELYIEYPFERYGHTSVHPFSYGGMEHQTLTTSNRSWLHGGNESGFAHELMHQWTGDYVTCATWADIWLNEGGATFGEALWAEYTGGKQSYHNFLRSAKYGYMSVEQPAVWGIPMDNVFNYGTTYAKAGWVYAMLRYVVGDSVFFPTMRKYLREHAFSYAETEDMLAVFEREAPSSIVPIRAFFEQWLYQRGHPEYDLEFNSQAQGGGYITKLILKQKQQGVNVPDVFVMPVNLTLKNSVGKKQIVKVLNNEREQEYEFTTDFPVASILVDEDDDILCVKSQSALTVSEAPASKISIAPNPILNNQITLQFTAPDAETLARITLCDMTGRIVQTICNTIVSAGNYTITRECAAPAGVYFARFEIGGSVTALPVTIIR